MYPWLTPQEWVQKVLPMWGSTSSNKKPYDLKAKQRKESDYLYILWYAKNNFSRKERSNSSIQEAYKRSLKNKILYSVKFKKSRKLVTFHY